MKKLPYFILGGLAVFGVGAYLYYKKGMKPVMSTPISSSTTKNPTPVVTAQNLTPVNTPILNYDGTLSGTTNTATASQGSNTSTTTGANTQANEAYAANLAKANKAFAELMTLKDTLLNAQIRLSGMTPPTVGGGMFGSGGSLGYSTTKSLINRLIGKDIPAKEKEIFNLGFKVIGNQLFAI